MINFLTRRIFLYRIALIEDNRVGPVLVGPKDKEGKPARLPFFSFVRLRSIP
jgi:hypothetical protein